MRVAILGASGATGRLLVEEALGRGLEVTAIARDPARIPVPDQPGLRKVAADVRDADSVARAVAGSEVLLSGLGNAKGDKPGALTAGAWAAIESGVGRVIWLGALGTGESAQVVGAFARTLIGLILKSELSDKAAADGAVLAAGGTVFHAGPLSNGSVGPKRRTLTLEQAPRRFFPAGVSRATVAAAMVEEAVKPQFPGRTVLPVTT